VSSGVSGREAVRAIQEAVAAIERTFGGGAEWRRVVASLHLMRRILEEPPRTWLTGFDAPSLHTIYLDKPMRGHGLMQAIARVTREARHLDPLRRVPR